MPGRPLKENDYGLKTLVEGHDPNIDVVAIHGTGAHPDDTWCQKRSPELPVADPASYIYWLKDLLPDVLPRARIMRYGYASSWFGPSMILTSATEISRELLEALEYERKEKRRPLLLLAHSFGGVIVMRMVRDAYEDFPDVHNSIAGMVFFGTPFRGSDTTTQETLLRLAHENHDRVEPGQIESMSGVYLDGVLADFLNTLKRLPMPRVLCIYEMVQTQVASVITREGQPIYSFWVDRRSATLDVLSDMVDQRGRRCDHLQLNKYGPGNEFRVLATALSKMADEADDKVRQRRKKSREIHNARAAAQYSGHHPGTQEAVLLQPKPTPVIVAVAPAHLAPRSPKPTSRPDTPVSSALRDRPPSGRLDVRWDNPEWFDMTIDGHMKRWDFAAMALGHMLRRDPELEPSPFVATIRYRSQPYDEDLNHSWHFARVSKSSIRYCLKMAKQYSPADMVSVRASHLARFLALDFSERLTETLLDFQTQSLFEESGRQFILMPLLGEELIDYDHAVPTVSAVVARHAAVCRAFSHYTHLISDRRCLVDGLRGKDLMLATPTVHDKDWRFEVGGGGIKQFFARHLCNEYCRKLKLSTPAERASFQKEWSRGEVRMCNNKLCRRFFRKAVLEIVVEGCLYGFCEVCAPQMALYKRKQYCRKCKREVRAESEFWYAARGLAVPDLCETHGEKA